MNNQTWTNPHDIDIFSFTPEPCRASEKQMLKYPRITCEAKLDGLRYILMIRYGEITLTGRRTSEKTAQKINRIANHPTLATAILETGIQGTWILDCELTHPKGLHVVQGMMNSLPEESERKMIEHGFPILHIFDCLAYGTKNGFEDLRQHSLGKRREYMMIFLRQLYEHSVTMGAFVRCVPIMDLGDKLIREEHITASFNHALRQGHEGIIVKNMDGAYHKNNMFKIKPKQTFDMIILGYDDSTAQSFAGDAVAALILGLYNSEGKLVFTTKCSGLTDSMRYEFFRNKQKYLGQVCEVEAQEMFSTGALRHPRFKCMRPDLEPTDQTFTKYNIFEGKFEEV